MTNMKEYHHIKRKLYSSADRKRDQIKKLEEKKRIKGHLTLNEEARLEQYKSEYNVMARFF
jgi:hypothetical protein